MVLTGNAIKDREAELQPPQAQPRADLAGRAAELKPYADFDQLASERVATVRDLAGRRFDWEQVHPRPLPRHPGRRHALRAQRQRQPTATPAAAAARPARRDRRAGDHGQGLHRHQRGVARLMARLRNVDGVTRVSLAKSEKTEQRQASAPAPTVPGASRRSPTAAAAPCGTGRKPQFEMVMFFEGDADAAYGPGAPPRPAGRHRPPPRAPADGSSATAAAGQPDARPRPASDWRDAAPAVDPGRGLAVTKNPKLLIAVVAVMAAVGAYWMLVLAPKREEPRQAGHRGGGRAGRASARPRRRSATYEKAQGAYRDQLRHGRAPRQGRPGRRRRPLARRAARLRRGEQRRRLRTITVGEGRRAARPTVADAPAGCAPPPGAVSVGPAGFSAMPFTFGFDGEFDNLSAFFSNLERFVTVSNDKIDVTGRLLRLESLSLTPDERRPRASRPRSAPARTCCPRRRA